MSISPAQMMLQAASAASAASTGGSTKTAALPAARSIEPTPEPPTPKAAAPPPAQFSTDLRVDAQHQLYYEVIDDSDGDVLFQIPPEALRAIGESLNVPLVGDASIPSVDVKS